MLHDFLILTLMAAGIAIAVGSFVGCLTAALKLSDLVNARWSAITYAMSAAFLLVVVFGIEYAALSLFVS